MKVVKGKAYKIKNSIAKKHGIFNEVICANDCGASGFYALALLKKPKIDPSGIKLLLNEYIALKFKDIIN